jgi:hypothetical protein
LLHTLRARNDSKMLSLLVDRYDPDRAGKCRLMECEHLPRENDHEFKSRLCAFISAGSNDRRLHRGGNRDCRIVFDAKIWGTYA